MTFAMASDLRVFPVVRRIAPDGQPIIEWLRWVEFPRSLKRHHFGRMLAAGRIHEFRCFLTGARLYWAPPNLLKGRSLYSLPWAMTREHLVAIRHGGEEVKRPWNLMPCSRCFNHHAGHMPLAIKLFVRDGLASLDFDREGMRCATAGMVKEAMIALQRRFLFRGRLAYQPHTYAAPDEIAAVRAFNAALAEYEAQIIGLPPEERATVLSRPLAFDVEGLFRRLMGPQPMLDTAPATGLIRCHDTNIPRRGSQVGVAPPQTA